MNGRPGNPSSPSKPQDDAGGQEAAENSVFEERADVAEGDAKCAEVLVDVELRRTQ